ncbi:MULTISPECIES: hypothetical protein [unclassified Clostridium]|uniref:hypothetical protein n=1 Tax=unclassified Clostridium TaxID=2614128 RepID=UPI0002980D0E|nr:MULTISPECIES: hypothetical protein [unclassified Clostridium]EKQ51648.1 MAG: hypothetical protein A370_04631 [Clostridium sp. Maddingley MBC34-26]
MSLVVSIISKEDDINVEEIQNEIAYPYSELFGFESWRYEIWGNSIIKFLGCDMLYSLNNNNIYAYGDDIQKLKLELIKISNNIQMISNVTKIDEKIIEVRINNALEAIRISEKYKDKVGISIK